MSPVPREGESWRERFEREKPEAERKLLAELERLRLEEAAAEKRRREA